MVSTNGELLDFQHDLAFSYATPRRIPGCQNRPLSTIGISNFIECGVCFENLDDSLDNGVCLILRPSKDSR
jgi:hypothetical protein